MRRLTRLSVSEVSLVAEGANRKKYLITKSRKKGSSMPDVSIQDSLMSVPQEKLEAFARIAKAKFKGKDGKETVLDDNAQAAMKAAMRILEPHSKSIPAPKIQEMLEAMSADGADAAEAEDDAELAEDETIMADEDELNKAKGRMPWQKDAGEKDGDDDDADEKRSAKKSADADDEEDEDEDDVNKCVDGPGIGETHFSGPADDRKKDALKKARASFVSTMKAMGYDMAMNSGQSNSVSTATPPVERSNVAKSADHINLESFTPEQRAALTPILKSQAQASERMAIELREAIAKSTKLQDELDRKEFVAKAAAFPHLGPAEKLGEQMLALHKKDPEMLVQWLDVFKSANAASDASGLFEERGSRLGSMGGADDKIAQAVAGIVQKSNMSKEKAEAQFLETAEGRALYKQSRKEAERAKRSM